MHKDVKKTPTPRKREDALESERLRQERAEKLKKFVDGSYGKKR